MTAICACFISWIAVGFRGEALRSTRDGLGSSALGVWYLMFLRLAISKGLFFILIITSFFYILIVDRLREYIHSLLIFSVFHQNFSITPFLTDKPKWRPLLFILQRWSHLRLLQALILTLITLLQEVSMRISELVFYNPHTNSHFILFPNIIMTFTWQQPTQIFP